MISVRPSLFHALLAATVWLIWWYAGGGCELVGLIERQWPVTLTMVFGSFIAGATSEGGGAIAFPVFTKLLEIHPADAKVFSLAIQSVGMTSASLVIVAMRVPVEWRVILWASLAGIPGMLLGAAVIAPLLTPAFIKLSFTLLVTSFAVTLYALNRDIRLCHEHMPSRNPIALGVVAAAGFIGGVMSGLVGNGIDIITFSVIVLLFRISEKVATPTSVILMAINSIVGFALHAWFIGGFTAEIQDWWLSAIPVVVVGAPLGAIVCSRLDRHIIAKFLIGLIFIEFVTSLWLIPMTPSLLLSSSLLLALFTGVYYWMYRFDRYEPCKV